MKTRINRLPSALFVIAAILIGGPLHAQSDDLLQRQIDRAEIEELVALYVHALDTLDADAYASVFTEDAVYETPMGVYEGRAAIRKIVTDLQENRARAEAAGTPPLALYHVMSNSSIEIIDVDVARHKSYAQTVSAREGGQFVVGFMGRYEDVIVKRDGRWQIQSRKLVSFVR
jgi:3-phenylpropionate/cinnamic acid dioxygenase small subunit